MEEARFPDGRRKTPGLKGKCGTDGIGRVFRKEEDRGPDAREK